MSEEFGLWAMCPKDAKVAWGARAILKDGNIDLVWDRQSWRGSGTPEHERFLPVLQEALKEARRECLRLWDAHVIRQDQDNLVRLFHGPGCAIVANTNASYGYLYMIAYPVEAEKQTVPTPLGDLPPKRCGVYYSAHECWPVPKNAKFKVTDRGGFDGGDFGRRVRYFASEAAANKHCRKLNRDVYDPRERVYPERIQ